VVRPTLLTRMSARFRLLTVFQNMLACLDACGLPPARRLALAARKRDLLAPPNPLTPP
jgi:hypothetical protein